jgi:hypothetical protein
MTITFTPAHRRVIGLALAAKKNTPEMQDFISEVAISGMEAAAREGRQAGRIPAIKALREALNGLIDLISAKDLVDAAWDEHLEARADYLNGIEEVSEDITLTFEARVPSNVAAVKASDEYLGFLHVEATGAGEWDYCVITRSDIITYEGSNLAQAMGAIYNLLPGATINVTSLSFWLHDYHGIDFTDALIQAVSQ